MYQHARVTSARSGRSRSQTSITPLVEICLRWYATTWLRTSTAPRCTVGRAELRAAVLGDDRDVGLGARLRVLVGVVVRREHRDVIAQVELVDAVLPTLVQVDRAGMRDREHARVVDGADRALARRASIEPVLDRRTAAEPDARRAGGRSPRPVHLPAARREQVGVHELAHRVVEAVAEPAFVVGRERELVRRARDLRAQHERVLRVHDRALGQRGRVSSAGCATYHWSSWSSPATSTAADRRPVRPARPACCHIDASVPGKPLSTTASRPPTSMPSSSAFVAAMPSSRPLVSSSSSSRRSSGR